MKQWRHHTPALRCSRYTLDQKILPSAARTSPRRPRLPRQIQSTSTHALVRSRGAVGGLPLATTTNVDDDLAHEADHDAGESLQESS